MGQMSAPQLLKAVLFANITLFFTFIFLPVFLLTDHITAFEDMIEFLH